MMVLRLRFDETPTKVRIVDPACEGAGSTACADDVFIKTQSSSLHTKVMQVEYGIGLLMYDRKADKYTWVFGELPTALRAVPSTNGPNTFQCLRDVIDSVPGLEQFAFANDFKLTVRHCCSDAYSANFVAERLLTEQMHSWTPSHTLCDIHKLYTATKTAMSTVDWDISGLLNLSLALSGAGTVSSLRKILARLFGKHLVIVYEHPPERAKQYLQALLDTFVPISGVDDARKKQNAKRRYILSYFLNGRFMDCGDTFRAEHYCPFACCKTPGTTLHHFSQSVTWALIPCALHKFPRSRWTNYDRSIDWCGLLAGLGFLQPLIFEFAGKANPKAPLGTNSDAVTGTGALMDCASTKDSHDDDWSTLYLSNLSAEQDQGVPTTEEDRDLTKHDAALLCNLVLVSNADWHFSGMADGKF
eukprot:Skav212718  [mRNA]  locus=scaffold113:593428:599229:+ [translate_table: standard]